VTFTVDFLTDFE